MELKNKKVDVLLNSKVKKLIRNNQQIVGAELADGNIIYGDYFILCNWWFIISTNRFIW